MKSPCSYGFPMVFVMVAIIHWEYPNLAIVNGGTTLQPLEMPCGGINSNFSMGFLPVYPLVMTNVANWNMANING